jgi:hypothetical protein
MLHLSCPAGCTEGQPQHHSSNPDSTKLSSRNSFNSQECLHSAQETYSLHIAIYSFEECDNNAMRIYRMQVGFRNDITD